MRCIGAIVGLGLVVLVGCGAQPKDMVLLRGSPVVLEGQSVEVGQKAPDVRMVGQDMQDMRLSDFEGRVVVLATVPSLDTGVCSMETRTFNERAADLSDDIVILTVSMDLPMAQARWCGANDVERVVTASDYKYREVGRRFGVRIRENALLARAVFVIDEEGVVRYRQVVPEITEEPDYDAALDAAREAT